MVGSNGQSNELVEAGACRRQPGHPVLLACTQRSMGSPSQPPTGDAARARRRQQKVLVRGGAVGVCVRGAPGLEGVALQHHAGRALRARQVVRGAAPAK